MRYFGKALGILLVSVLFTTGCESDVADASAITLYREGACAAQASLQEVHGLKKMNAKTRDRWERYAAECIRSMSVGESGEVFAAAALKGYKLSDTLREVIEDSLVLYGVIGDTDGRFTFAFAVPAGVSDLTINGKSVAAENGLAAVTERPDVFTSTYSGDTQTAESDLPLTFEIGYRFGEERYSVKKVVQPLSMVDPKAFRRQRLSCSFGNGGFFQSRCTVRLEATPYSTTTLTGTGGTRALCIANEHRYCNLQLPAEGAGEEYIVKTTRPGYTTTMVNTSLVWQSRQYDDTPWKYMRDNVCGGVCRAIKLPNLRASAEWFEGFMVHLPATIVDAAVVGEKHVMELRSSDGPFLAVSAAGPRDFRSGEGVRVPRGTRVDMYGVMIMLDYINGQRVPLIQPIVMGSPSGHYYFQ